MPRRCCAINWLMAPNKNETESQIAFCRKTEEGTRYLSGLFRLTLCFVAHDLFLAASPLAQHQQQASKQQKGREKHHSQDGETAICNTETTRGSGKRREGQGMLKEASLLGLGAPNIPFASELLELSVTTHQPPQMLRTAQVTKKIRGNKRTGMS